MNIGNSELPACRSKVISVGDAGDVLEGNIVVSIGFCIKNVEDTVGDAVDSILSQDFDHRLMEVIVVECKSRDRTNEIVNARLRKGDIRYRIIGENSGLGKARQIALENSAGKYIVWIDGDMRLPKTYVRKQVEFMEKNPHVGIAGGKYGVHAGQGVVADLENMVYVVDSVYGEKGASNLGYLPGTEGSIYRVKATREIGGFDTRIDGAAEDTEITYRLKASGWETAITNEVFTESTRKSWKSLWDQYFWYGRGGHFVSHKNAGMITVWMMTPLSGFVAGLLRCVGAYRITCRKIAFLLPFHYTFKRMAWFAGFLKAHIDGYGHFD